VVAEFSLALTLLASGGLAFKGFWNLTKVDLGIRPDHVLTFQLPVTDPRMVEPDRIRSYYQQMLEKIEAVPGVKRIGAMTGVLRVVHFLECESICGTTGGRFVRKGIVISNGNSGMF
jgi:hypothetical protein